MRFWIEVIGEVRLTAQSGSSWRLANGSTGVSVDTFSWLLESGETAMVIVDDRTAERLRRDPNVLVLGESE